MPDSVWRRLKRPQEISLQTGRAIRCCESLLRHRIGLRMPRAHREPSAARYLPTVRSCKSDPRADPRAAVAGPVAASAPTPSIRRVGARLQPGHELGHLTASSRRGRGAPRWFEARPVPRRCSDAPSPAASACPCRRSPPQSSGPPASKPAPVRASAAPACAPALRRRGPELRRSQIQPRDRNRYHPLPPLALTAEMQRSYDLGILFRSQWRGRWFSSRTRRPCSGRGSAPRRARWSGRRSPSRTCRPRRAGSSRRRRRAARSRAAAGRP